jgi:drug/metabolite transporter (DMT)-like permease
LIYNNYYAIYTIYTMAYKKVDSYFYFYLLFITIFSISSQYVFKKIHLIKNNTYNHNFLLVLGLVLYTSTGFCVYNILKYGNIIILNVLWHLVYFIILFLMGYILFKEKITYQKMIALVFGMISVFIFMSYGID